MNGDMAGRAGEAEKSGGWQAHGALDDVPGAVYVLPVDALASYNHGAQDPAAAALYHPSYGQLSLKIEA